MNACCTAQSSTLGVRGIACAAQSRGTGKRENVYKGARFSTGALLSVSSLGRSNACTARSTRPWVSSRASRLAEDVGTSTGTSAAPFAMGMIVLSSAPGTLSSPTSSTDSALRRVRRSSSGTRASTRATSTDIRLAISVTTNVLSRSFPTSDTSFASTAIAGSPSEFNQVRASTASMGRLSRPRG